MGTRPEVIKFAPLVHELQSFPAEFDVKVCVTGQHKEMLQQTLRSFGLTPDVDLALMTPSQNLSELHARILTGMAQVLSEERPDLLLVQGDTTTTVAAAMSAFYLGVPVGHVEAGLRTYDPIAPFPEELNRQVTSRIARWHFAPTEANRKALLGEGCPDSHIFVTGNTVIDSLLWMIHRLDSDTAFQQETYARLDSLLPFSWRQVSFILVTGHRRENFGDGLREICLALGDIASARDDLHLVYPVHLNPEVRHTVQRWLGGRDNVHLIPPVEYGQMVSLMRFCNIIITDSGGIQEEAPTLGKPVLLTRGTTERPEGVASGAVRLVGTARHDIEESVLQLLGDPLRYQGMAGMANPFGDGQASRRIVEHLRHILSR